MRQDLILKMIEEHGERSVEQLASAFGVSDMTIRRDLHALADAGKVIRTHGGAAPAVRVAFEFQFLNRARCNQPAKSAIGRVAAQKVRDGQSIMLDSGTTTLELARHLRGKEGVTVVTTSLPIASELQFSQAIDIVLLGGLLRRDAPDLIGALTESNLETLHADIAFIGADGIDLQGNIYNVSLAVGRMLGKMAAASSQVFVVADSSKINRPAFSRFGNIRDWDGLITDDGIEPDHRVALQDAGVRVEVVKTARKAKAS